MNIFGLGIPELVVIALVIGALIFLYRENKNKKNIEVKPTEVKTGK